jgi:hypothetical protein
VQPLGYIHSIPSCSAGRAGGIRYYGQAPNALDWPEETKDAPQLPRPPGRTAVRDSEPISHPEAARLYETGIAALQDAVRPFVRGRGAREKAETALCAFATAQLSAESVKVEENKDTLEDKIRRVYCERIVPLLPVDRRDGAQSPHIRTFNLAAARLYLDRLTGGRSQCDSAGRSLRPNWVRSFPGNMGESCWMRESARSSKYSISSTTPALCCHHRH